MPTLCEDIYSEISTHYKLGSKNGYPPPTSTSTVDRNLVWILEVGVNWCYKISTVNIYLQLIESL